jgi:hypothetical protein
MPLVEGIYVRPTRRLSNPAEMALDEFVFAGRNCDCKPRGERPVIKLMLPYRRKREFLASIPRA